MAERFDRGDGRAGRTARDEPEPDDPEPDDPDPTRRRERTRRGTRVQPSPGPGHAGPTPDEPEDDEPEEDPDPARPRASPPPRDPQRAIPTGEDTRPGEAVEDEQVEQHVRQHIAQEHEQIGEDDIQEVRRVDDDRFVPVLTRGARLEMGEEEFRRRRRRGRMFAAAQPGVQEADVVPLHEFDDDELAFELGTEGVQVRPTDEAEAEFRREQVEAQRAPEQQPGGELEIERDPDRMFAGTERVPLGLDEDDFERRRTEDGEIVFGLRDDAAEDFARERVAARHRGVEPEDIDVRRDEETGELIAEFETQPDPGQPVTREQAFLDTVTFGLTRDIRTRGEGDPESALFDTITFGAAETVREREEEALGDPTFREERFIGEVSPVETTTIDTRTVDDPADPTTAEQQALDRATGGATRGVRDATGGEPEAAISQFVGRPETVAAAGVAVAAPEPVTTGVGGAVLGAAAISAAATQADRTEPTSPVEETRVGIGQTVGQTELEAEDTIARQELEAETVRPGAELEAEETVVRAELETPEADGRDPVDTLQTEQIAIGRQRHEQPGEGSEIDRIRRRRRRLERDRELREILEGPGGTVTIGEVDDGTQFIRRREFPTGAGAVIGREVQREREVTEPTVDAQPTTIEQEFLGEVSTPRLGTQQRIGPALDQDVTPTLDFRAAEALATAQATAPRTDLMLQQQQALGQQLQTGTPTFGEPTVPELGLGDPTTTAFGHPTGTPRTRLLGPRPRLSRDERRRREEEDVLFGEGVFETGIGDLDDLFNDNGR